LSVGRRRAPVLRHVADRPLNPQLRLPFERLYRIADERVSDLLALARALLADNAEHVAACRRIDSAGC
jgi:hypothetical protein